MLGVALKKPNCKSKNEIQEEIQIIIETLFPSGYNKALIYNTRWSVLRWALTTTNMLLRQSSCFSVFADKNMCILKQGNIHALV